MVLDSDRNNFCVVILFFLGTLSAVYNSVCNCGDFEIEMLIHTQYVITGDGWLKVETGRFIPNASLEIDQILRIRKVRSMTFWQPALSFERLEVVFKKHGKVRSISLSPKNQEDFIRCLLKKNEAIQFYD